MVKNKYKRDIEKGDMIWKDKKTNEVIITSVILISLIIFIMAFLIIGSLIEKLIFAVVFGIIGLYALYVQLLRKLTILYTSGILLGNINLDKWHRTGLRKRFFLEWKDINYIKLRDREVKVPRGSWARTFIIIKVKDNKRYDCVIYNPKEFVEALKKINKYNLLTNDSRYK